MLQDDCANRRRKSSEPRTNLWGTPALMEVVADNSIIIIGFFINIFYLNIITIRLILFTQTLNSKFFYWSLNIYFNN